MLLPTALSWWHGIQRGIDIQMLWPQCKEQASDLDHAKAAFMYHCMHDPAWLCLGEEEIVRRIDALK